MDLENSRHENELPIGGSIPDSIEIKDAIVEEKEKPQIFKDERDINGNGYVEFLIEATPVRTDGVHQFKVGYQVSNIPSGLPGKQWQKLNENDLGPLPKTDTIQ